MCTFQCVLCVTASAVVLVCSGVTVRVGSLFPDPQLTLTTCVCSSQLALQQQIYPICPVFFFFCGETLRCHNLIKVPPQNRIWAIYISTPDSCTQTCQPVFPVFLLMQGNLVDSLSSQHLFVVFPPEHILGNWTFSKWENWEIGLSITDGT